MTFTARSIHHIRFISSIRPVGYAKTIAIVIAALCCAVWLGGCKDSTPTTGEAAAPQAEATAPATPENPLLAMAQLEPGADGQPPRLTLYGLTLDAPLPDYPACTDDMLWQRDAPGPCFLPNNKNDGGERRPAFELVDELGGVIYPTKMMDTGYPYSVTIGFDVQGVQYMRVFTDGGISTQHQYVEVLNKLLGEPILIHIKEGGNSDRGANAPVGVSRMMWVSSENGAVVVIWETDYAWARYVGQSEAMKRGYLEFGLKRILRNGQLPDW
ncbi:hypothetical protein [Saezia sanguinis]|uniref:hypothetical protein n=1 Tax=Saezia sanguinis TaxID=1965230 RepID=UPI0030588965